MPCMEPYMVLGYGSQEKSTRVYLWNRLQHKTLTTIHICVAAVVNFGVRLEISMTLVSSDPVLPLSSQIHSHFLLSDSGDTRWAAKTPKTSGIFSICAPPPPSVSAFYYSTLNSICNIWHGPKGGGLTAYLTRRGGDLTWRDPAFVS